MRFALIGAAYLGRSKALDTQECVNLYPELSPSPEAKSVSSLVGTPGLKLLTTISGSGGCRGIFTTARDRLLVVNGNTLWEITSGSYALTNRGTLNTYQGQVTFAEIDKQPDPASAAVSQVFIADGNYGYVFNTQTNDFKVVTGDYMPGNCVISQNGFFLQNLNDSNKWIYSNLYDGLTWEASLNYFTAESSPDQILWMTLLNNLVWIYGTKSIEIWQFSGDPNQLWTRSGIGYINVGLAGKTAATTINGHVYWIGAGPTGSNIVWHSGPSYAPDRVSTHAIEAILGAMSKVDDCVAFSYQDLGHQFIVFNFPTGDRTLVYDMTTDLWHERGDLDVPTGQNHRHRAICATSWQGMIIVGDDVNGYIYQWDIDQKTDAGKAIKRLRVCPHIHAERKRIFFSQLEIDMEKGTADQSGQGSDPQVMMRFSNDGGYTYSPINIWATSGKVGARLTRVQFNKLGMSRDRVFEISMTDPVKVVWIDARINARVEA